LQCLRPSSSRESDFQLLLDIFPVRIHRFPSLWLSPIFTIILYSLLSFIFSDSITLGKNPLSLSGLNFLNGPLSKNAPTYKEEECRIFWFFAVSKYAFSMLKEKTRIFSDTR
jgi:hypothetical protein